MGSGSDEGSDTREKAAALLKEMAKQARQDFRAFLFFLLLDLALGGALIASVPAGLTVLKLSESTTFTLILGGGLFLGASLLVLLTGLAVRSFKRWNLVRSQILAILLSLSTSDLGTVKSAMSLFSDQQPKSPSLGTRTLRFFLDLKSLQLRFERKPALLANADPELALPEANAKALPAGPGSPEPLRYPEPEGRAEPEE